MRDCQSETSDVGLDETINELLNASTDGTIAVAQMTKSGSP